MNPEPPDRSHEVASPGSKCMIPVGHYAKDTYIQRVVYEAVKNHQRFLHAIMKSVH